MAETVDGIGPGPVRLGALRRLAALEGQREKGGRNWGPIVQRVAGPFISPPRLESYAPGGSRAGRLFWCALTVCWAFLEELEARGHTEVANQWKRIASASCKVLHHNLSLHGWCWRPGEPLPRALCPQGAEAPGLPAPGDLCFYGAWQDDKPDLRHVDFYARDRGGGARTTLGGNTGPRGDSVAYVERQNESGVLFYARVPW